MCEKKKGEETTAVRLTRVYIIETNRKQSRKANYQSQKISRKWKADSDGSLVGLPNGSKTVGITGAITL